MPFLRSHLHISFHPFPIYHNLYSFSYFITSQNLLNLTNTDVLISSFPAGDSTTPFSQAEQSILAKLVMNRSLRRDQPTSAPPSAPSSNDYLAPLPPPSIRDVAVTAHPHNGAHGLPINAVQRVIYDLTDTPPNPRSVSSTAPNSPRM